MLFASDETLITTVPEPLLASHIASSALVGTDAPEAPPEEVEPIVIGYVGAFANDGAVSIERAVETAIDEFNKAGGICGGRPIKLVKADSALDVTEGIKGVEYLAEAEHIDFLVNGTVDDVCLGILPRLTEYRIPTVTCWASPLDPLLAMAEDYETYKWFFMKHTNDAFIATGLILFAGWLHEELGWDSCVLMAEDTSWGAFTAPFLESELPASAGVEVLDTIMYDVDTVDFSPIFAKVVAQDPDFTFPVACVSSMIPAAQYVELQVPIPNAGVYCDAFAPDFWDDTGGLAAGLMSPNEIPNYSMDLDPVSQAFIDKYQARYPTRPKLPWFTGFFAYYGVYDAIEAAQRVYDAGLGSEFEPLDAWVEEMENTDVVLWRYGGFERRDDLSPTGEDWAFFIGRYYKPGELDPIMGMELPHSMKCDINMVDGIHPLSATQWYEDGTTACIWPERYKNGEIAFPAWISREKLPEKYR